VIDIIGSALGIVGHFSLPRPHLNPRGFNACKRRGKKASLAPLRARRVGPLLSWNGKFESERRLYAVVLRDVLCIHMLLPAHCCIVTDCIAAGCTIGNPPSSLKTRHACITSPSREYG
jgi:hypothetical protein